MINRLQQKIIAQILSRLIIYVVERVPDLMPYVHRIDLALVFSRYSLIIFSER
jgi:hypothetical protein